MQRLFRIAQCIFLMLMGVSSVALAGTGIRKYAGEFLTIDVSARAQGMGSAFVAVADEVSAIQYNPAGLIHVQETQLTFLHAWQFVNFMSFDYAAVAHPLAHNRVLGVSFSRLAIDDIPDTRNARVDYGSDWRLDWSKITTFNAADYALHFAVAQRWQNRLAVGIGVKLLHRSLGDFYANGIGMDAGLQWQLIPDWTLGVALRNLTTTLIAWNTGEKELVAPQVVIGNAYTFSLERFHTVFRSALDISIHTMPVSLGIQRNGQPINRALGAAIGGELVYRQALFVRGGMDELQRLNLGVGIAIPHLRFDYSYLNYDRELGNSHRVSIFIHWGSP